jgi:hypothetical protein
VVEAAIAQHPVKGAIHDRQEPLVEMRGDAVVAECYGLDQRVVRGLGSDLARTRDGSQMPPRRVRTLRGHAEC